jgi:uncharacterized protein (DUF1015 family)
VLTQPYDKISPAMQEKYYAADPHNLIAIEKGRTRPEDTPQINVYTRAAASLQQWIAQQVIKQEAAPAFYAYAQEYTVPGTTERLTRRGFIGLGRLEEYSAGVIFRHEHTLSGPKADRLELLRHTRTHTGQLFMLYADPQRRVDAVLEGVTASIPPLAEVGDEYGVTHRLWSIADRHRIAAIEGAMADQKLVIADGHHRYETSLNFRNENRTRAGKLVPEAPYEFSMMTFINTHSEGLTILPTHRVVANLRDFSWTGLRRYLEPWFATEEFSFGDAQRKQSEEKFLERLRAAKQQRAIAVYPEAQTGSRAFYLFTLRPGADLSRVLPGVSALQRELDVVLLHQGILEPVLGITPHAVASEANLTYEREAATALAAVDQGKAQVAFLLNPVDVDLVVKVATEGQVMPQKSTDFYPKLLSGITMYRVNLSE